MTQSACARAAQRLKDRRRQVDAGGAAPRREILDEGLHRFVDADGREREERAAQPQDAEPENQRQHADADAGREQAGAKRPSVRVHQPDADVAAEAEEDDAAEIDVAGITEHQIEIARQRDVERGEQQALAQLDVVADRRARSRRSRSTSAMIQKNGRRSSSGIRVLRALTRKCRRETRSARRRTARIRSPASSSPARTA